MDFANFLIGVFTPDSVEELTKRAEAAPLRINVSPIVFLSPPVDRESDFASPFSGQENAEADLIVTVQSHGFVYNPNRRDTELLLFVQPDNPDILSHLDIDILHFRPYLRLAVSVMRTRHIRFWCKNFADSLVGLKIPVFLTFSSDPALLENYNPTVEMDHPYAYSHGL